MQSRNLISIRGGTGQVYFDIVMGGKIVLTIGP